MKYVYQKIEYYLSWLKSLTPEEKGTHIEKWIRENIERYKMVLDSETNSI